MPDYELTDAETQTFLQSILHIDLEKNSTADRVEFLETVVRHYQEWIPFQTFTLDSKKPGDRKRPLWQEIKDALLTGKGGVCYVLNVFMYTVLKSLRYDVYLSHSTVKKDGDHLVVIVKNLQNEDDKNLIDVGFTNTTLGFVPLDFDNESPVFVGKPFPYKYKWLNGMIFRFHKALKGVATDDSSEGWHPVYSIGDDIFTDVHEFDTYFDNFYTRGTSPDESLLHNFPVACIFPYRKSVTVRKNKLFIEMEDGETSTHIIKDKVELFKIMREYFPVIPELEVSSAIQFFSVGY